MSDRNWTVGMFLGPQPQKELPLMPAPGLTQPALTVVQPSPPLTIPENLPVQSNPALSSPAILPVAAAPTLSSPATLPVESAPALSSPATLPVESAPALSSPATLPVEGTPSLYAPAVLPVEGTPSLYAPAVLPAGGIPALYAPANLPTETAPVLSAPAILPAEAIPTLYAPALLPTEVAPALSIPAALPTEAVPVLSTPAVIPVESAPVLSAPSVLPVETAPVLSAPAILPAEATPVLSAPINLPAEPAPVLSAPAVLPAEPAPVLSAPAVLPAEPAPALYVPDVLPAEPAPALYVPDALPAEPAPALYVPDALPAEPAPSLRVPATIPGPAVAARGQLPTELAVSNPVLYAPVALPAEPAPVLSAPSVLLFESPPKLSSPATLPAESVPVLSAPAVLPVEPQPIISAPATVSPTPSGNINLYQPVVLPSDGSSLISDILGAVEDAITQNEDEVLTDLSQLPTGSPLAGVVSAAQQVVNAAGNFVNPPQFAPSTDSSITDNEADYANAAGTITTIGSLLNLPAPDPGPTVLDMLQEALPQRNPYNYEDDYDSGARTSLARLIDTAINSDGTPGNGGKVGDVQLTPGVMPGGVGGVSAGSLANIASSPIGSNPKTPAPSPLSTLAKTFVGASGINLAEQRPQPATAITRVLNQASTLAKAAFIHGLIPTKFSWDNDQGFMESKGNDDGARDDEAYLPLVFTDLRPIGNVYRSVWFRPFNLKLVENYNPEWNKRTFFGRVDPVVTYAGTSRGLTLSFMLAAFGPEDLRPIWQKLNWLASMVYPSYDKDLAYSSGPVIRLRVGDVTSGLGPEGNRGTPGVIESMTFDYNDALWELKKDWKVPRNIAVQLNFQVLHDMPIGVGSNGQFGGLGSFDGSGNYLPPGASTASPGNSNSKNSPTVADVGWFRDVGSEDIINGYGQLPSTTKTPPGSGS